MGVYDYQSLRAHYGHRIVCAGYGTAPNFDNIALECETCGEVLVDFNHPAVEPPDSPPVCVECGQPGTAGYPLVETAPEFVHREGCPAPPPTEAEMTLHYTTCPGFYGQPHCCCNEIAAEIRGSDEE